jgi:hypothetical protein
MKKYIKENKNTFIILAIILIILAFIFYWFQLRPTNIKKNCSQKITTIPADAGVTKEQAELNAKEFEKCKLKFPEIPFTGEGVNSFFIFMHLESMKNKLYDKQREEIDKCYDLSRNIVERDPSPERKVIGTESNENKYNQCLRQHGL